MGLPRSRREDLAGGTKEENAAIIRALFAGERGPKRDALLANAAAALVVGGKVRDLKAGIELAGQVIDGGIAKRKLEEWVRVSQSVSE